MDIKMIKRKINENITGWHLIIIAVFLIGFGVFSMLKIQNSHSYSLKSVILGIMFLIGGIAWYVLNKK